MGINLSNIRHIVHTSYVNILTSSSLNAGRPSITFNSGCIFINKNKNYYIKNINVTQTNARTNFSFGGAVGFINVFHRFYSGSDPILPYVNKALSRGDDIYVNNTKINTLSDYKNNFNSIDIIDTQDINYSNNKITYNYLTQYTAQLNEINTNTKHDSCLFPSINHQKTINDFYFESGSNSYLCFSIFPSAVMSSDQFLDFNYIINFDLIQD